MDQKVQLVHHLLCSPHRCTYTIIESWQHHTKKVNVTLDLFQYSTFYFIYLVAEPLIFTSIPKWTANGINLIIQQYNRWLWHTFGLRYSAHVTNILVFIQWPMFHEAQSSCEFFGGYTSKMKNDEKRYLRVKYQLMRQFCTKGISDNLNLERKSRIYSNSDFHRKNTFTSHFQIRVACKTHIFNASIKRQLGVKTSSSTC